MTQKYVVGFLFDEEEFFVALVLKNRPQWQKGRLNGIGGKIERHTPSCRTNGPLYECDQMNYDPCDCSGETPEDAMRREFREEAGLDISTWKEFNTHRGPGFELHFFYAHVPLNTLMQVKSITDEQVGVYSVKELPELGTITNLQWLIPMARTMRDEHADRFEIQEIHRER